MNKKMVEWQWSRWFFGDRARILTAGTNAEYDLAIDHVLNTFLKRYNCEMNGPRTYYSTTITCSEEDFLIIKLSEPGAIRFVVSTF